MGEAINPYHPFWRDQSLPIAERLYKEMKKTYEFLKSHKEATSEMYVWLRNVETEFSSYLNQVDFE